MPIVSDPKQVGASINGDFGSLLSSLDDEESFVVLERSTANDVSSNSGSLSLAQAQTLNNVGSFHVSGTVQPINRISQSSQVEIDPIPIPYDSSNISVNAEEIQKRLQEVLVENISLKENLYQTNLAMKQQLSTVRLLQERALETQKNHQAKFEETKTLILKLGSEKNELQEKVNELSVELYKLKEENKDLKETNLAFGSEASKLLTENSSLKKQLTSAHESLQTMTEKEKKVSLQLQQPTAKELELHEVVDQLTRKLETVERSRRQQEFDIDKLQAQLARCTEELNEAQRKLAHSENAFQAVQEKNDNSIHYGEKLTKYDTLLKQFKASIQEEQTRFNSLNSWLTMTDPTGNAAQFEISELRRLLAEEQAQSVSRKEKLDQAVKTIYEMLGDFKKLGENLERVKADHAVKESHGLAYDEMQKKGFREQIDSLTAKLVEKEEALAISERHLSSLQEAVRLQNDEKKGAFTFLGMFDTGEVTTLKEQVKNLLGEVTAKEEEIGMKNKEIDALKSEIQKLRANVETIAVLEEQAKIYQADFEAERKSRESLVTEKEKFLDDIRHLQKRNKELIEEVEILRRESAQQNTSQTAETSRTRQQEQTPSPPAPRPQDEEVPPPKRYYCPNPECNMIFATVEPLQLHVITCLKLDD